MKVNINKIKVIQSRYRCTDYNNFEIFNTYKYLGVVMKENVTFSITTDILINSVGRAFTTIFSFGPGKNKCRQFAIYNLQFCKLPAQPPCIKMVSHSQMKVF